MSHIFVLIEKSRYKRCANYITNETRFYVGASCEVLTWSQSITHFRIKYFISQEFYLHSLGYLILNALSSALQIVAKLHTVNLCCLCVAKIYLKTSLSLFLSHFTIQTFYMQLNFFFPYGDHWSINVRYSTVNFKPHIGNIPKWGWVTSSYAGL